MAALKREDFKSKHSTKATVVGTVTVPAMGGDVSICKLSAGGRDRVSSALMGLGSGKDSGTYRARLVVETACDEHGVKLFADDDIKWLAGLDYEILEPIVDEANKLNKFDTPEDLEKN